MSDWQLKAACKGLDQEIFFDGHNTAEARNICVACPVRVACLDYALQTKQEYGVWGGTTPDERERMLDDNLTRETYRLRSRGVPQGTSHDDTA